MIGRQVITSQLWTGSKTEAEMPAAPYCVPTESSTWSFHYWLSKYPSIPPMDPCDLTLICCPQQSWCCHSVTGLLQHGVTSGQTLPSASSSSSRSGPPSNIILTQAPGQKTWIKLKLFLVPRFLFAFPTQPGWEFLIWNLTPELCTLKCFKGWQEVSRGGIRTWSDSYNADVLRIPQNYFQVHTYKACIRHKVHV